MHIWALGLSCETPAAPPDRAAGARTRQPENSKRAHFRAQRFKHHQNSRMDPKRVKEERKFGREEGKKSAKCWAPHPSGLHPSGLPTLRGPTFSTLWASTLGSPPFEDPTLCRPKIQRPKIGRNRIGRSRNWPKSNWVILNKCGFTLHDILANQQSVMNHKLGVTPSCSFKESMSYRKAASKNWLQLRARHTRSFQPLQ